MRTYGAATLAPEETATSGRFMLFGFKLPTPAVTPVYDLLTKLETPFLQSWKHHCRGHFASHQCISEFPAKTEIYAQLTAITNVKDPEFVQDLLLSLG